MQLQLNQAILIGDGHIPAAFHSEDNKLHVLYVDQSDEDLKMHVKYAETPLGQWDSLAFSDALIAAPDKNIIGLSAHKLTGSKVWFSWRDEWINEGQEEVDRHRVSSLDFSTDISEFLESGQIRISGNNPIVQLALSVCNDPMVMLEDDPLLLAPGNMISIDFQAGGSQIYPLGRFFVDRSNFTVLSELINIDARNATGKLLKDQSFDDHGSFSYAEYKSLIEAILEVAGISNYWVGDTSGTSLGMSFAPSTGILDGLQEILKYEPAWKIYEDMKGRINIGRHYDVAFPQPGKYIFNRGSDVFSRQITRDDRSTYSRLCVHTYDFSRVAYRDIDFLGQWSMPRQKTLYSPVADGTSQADIDSYADVLAEEIASIGVVEQFVGPFRPQLIPGDQAEITSSNSAILIGVITEITHQFGKSGFTTTFTVDSGGKLKRTQLSDLIKDISKKPSSMATRSYE